MTTEEEPEEKKELPVLEVIRLSDREPCPPSKRRIKEVEERLSRSPFATNDD